MNVRIPPYLRILRNELNGPLRHENGSERTRQVARYVDRLLVDLLLREETLPALQRDALRAIDGYLDEILAATRGIEGSLALGSELLEHVRFRPDFTAFEPALAHTLQALLGAPGDAPKALVRRLSDTLLAMNEALDRAKTQLERDVPVASRDDAPALDEAQRLSLQSWLRAHFPGESAATVDAVRELVGGGSKRTLLVTLGSTRKLPADVVIRADQAAGVVQSTVTDEYRMLETVAAANLPVPRPFALETDASVIGTPFMLVNRIPGHNPGDHVECFEPSRSFALSLARALAGVHAIPAERFGDGVAGATTPTRESVRRNIAVFEAMWRNTGEHAIALQLAFDWLKTHMHLCEGRRALIHCDVGCHNMLAQDGELTGLLDWETAMIGNPAHDLGYAYPLVVQMVPWEDFIAEYRRAGGVAPSQGELDFYRVWTMAWRLPFLLVARSFLNAGLSTYIVHTYGAHHVYHHSSLLLHRLMQDIQSRY